MITNPFEPEPLTGLERHLIEKLASIATYGDKASSNCASTAAIAIVPDAHFCQEWDGMFILPWMPEAEACICFEDYPIRGKVRTGCGHRDMTPLVYAKHLPCPLCATASIMKMVDPLWQPVNRWPDEEPDFLTHIEDMLEDGPKDLVFQRKLLMVGPKVYAGHWQRVKATTEPDPYKYNLAIEKMGGASKPYYVKAEEIIGKKDKL